jgi:hypothetical protein
MSKAPFIENFFIDGQTLRVRNGSRKYSQRAASVAGDAILALGKYAAATGTESAYAIINRAGVYTLQNVTADPATSIAAVSLAASTIFIQFRSYFYAMDGSATPYAYDGTDWAAFGAAFATSGLTAGFTGPASVNNFIGGVAYKNRLYLVENNSARVWYGGVDSISGAMTSLDAASLLTKGGKLHYAATINYGQNSTAAAFLCLISDQGEVLAFQGSYPGSTNFEMVARFEVAKPLSRRGYLVYQGDTLVATETGLVSLRDMISYALGQGNGSIYKTYSNDIDPYWKTVVAFNKNSVTADLNNYFTLGYCKRTSCIYAYFSYGLIRTNNTLSFNNGTTDTLMFVFNTVTGAWWSYIYSNLFTSQPSMIEIGKYLLVGTAFNGVVLEIEKIDVYNDEDPENLSTYNDITANILSAALSSNRDSGVRQKFNSLELQAYMNAGIATIPVQCYLVENFGNTSAITKPAILEDRFNSIAFNVGSSREYVQYSLTIKTNTGGGDNTVLYNLNALMEQGGYR